MSSTTNLRWTNFDKTQAFQKLSDLPKPDIHELLTPERVNSYSIPTGGKLVYNYAARPVDDMIIAALSELADEQQLIAKYKALLSGERINTGENRMVLHHLTRGQLGSDVVEDGKNLRSFYSEQQQRIAEFAESVHKGEIAGSTGKPFKTVIQIGIGGSDLGPRALYLALESYAKTTPGMLKMDARFISNVDPDDANEVLRDVDFESALFVLVSKSGTTQETLTNREFAVRKMTEAGIDGLDPEAHMVAVTSSTSPLAKSHDYLESFYIDDYIGGRYSSTSAVGGVVLSLAYGPDTFAELLDGASSSDRAALEPNIKRNAALMDALIGVYERNILGMPVSAVLPYSQALVRFPAHLQQLDMESNGKSVNRFGEPVEYSTGPIIFGEPGTNGQHSFYQLLHQGTDPTPLQFVGFQSPQDKFDVEVDGATSQKKLKANLAAQIVAFAIGKEDEDKRKHFAGGRPSSLIYGDRLTPHALGALLSHFENKVMFQGFVWNINSFDQEGVQLGKVLTKQILAGGSLDPVIAAYASILRVR